MPKDYSQSIIYSQSLIYSPSCSKVSFPPHRPIFCDTSWLSSSSTLPAARQSLEHSACLCKSVSNKSAAPCEGGAGRDSCCPPASCCEMCSTVNDSQAAGMLGGRQVKGMRKKGKEWKEE